jgi:hypothetical protein
MTTPDNGLAAAAAAAAAAATACQHFQPAVLMKN